MSFQPTHASQQSQQTLTQDQYKLILQSMNNMNLPMYLQQQPTYNQHLNQLYNFQQQAMTIPVIPTIPSLSTAITAPKIIPLDAIAQPQSKFGLSLDPSALSNSVSSESSTLDSPISPMGLTPKTLNSLLSAPEFVPGVETPKESSSRLDAKCTEFIPSFHSVLTRAASHLSVIEEVGGDDEETTTMKNEFKK